MDLYSNNLYMEDVKAVAALPLPWNKLEGKTLMLSGATGMIGSFLVDVLLERKGTDCRIIGLTRSEDRAWARFSRHRDDPRLSFVRYDVKEPLPEDGVSGDVDFVLHLASNTHPLQYSTDPIGTITTNIIGLQNLLEFAVAHNVQRFAFASSNEIYGENRGDVELFDEVYCGYINSNTLRAGYPESKRCGEALCQAYKAQKGLDVVIPRLTRTYGPTLLKTDTKALSQFLRKGVNGEDVILKSAGTQFYSYLYVADSVSGLLYVLLCGESGMAYNIADRSSDITLKDLASIIAQMNGRKVVFEIPDAVEAAGYSKATKARLDGSRLHALGWKPMYDIRAGLERTVSILKVLS